MNALFNVRNPLWRVLGIGTILAALGGTAYYAARGVKPKTPMQTGGPFSTGTQGLLGVITEQLGENAFVLRYERLLGEKDNLKLSGVTGQMDESEAAWTMTAPEARRCEGVWTLQSPMDITSRQPRTQDPLGHGHIAGPGPALEWRQGVWTGLASLVWEDVGAQGKGRWHLPSGWYREATGRFVVNKGPVLWESLDDGALKRMTAQRLWTYLGPQPQEGHMEEIHVELKGGRLDAASADVGKMDLRWHAPLNFQRDDGWTGSAEEATCPRPEPGAALERVELKHFRAARSVSRGEEKLQATGVRWTSAGLRLEGDVRLEHPLDGKAVLLRAPRVLMREAAGMDLPADLPVGEVWAETSPILTWSGRTLSSPRMEAWEQKAAGSAKAEISGWRLRAPVRGRGEQGTFTAGEGTGSPKHWQFCGPVEAKLFAYSATIRGDLLTWEDGTWTFQGHPAIWTGIRERLAGRRIIRRPDRTLFPEGVGGSLADAAGDMTVQADQAEWVGGVLSLQGRVRCEGQGWRLNGRRVSVTLGARNEVKHIVARGSVVLTGRMGEGRGEELDFDPATGNAHWQGNVRGVAEVAQ